MRSSLRLNGQVLNYIDLCRGAVCDKLENKHLVLFSCRWQTRATRYIRANVLQTKVDATCDRTKLTTPRVESRQFSATYATYICRLRWGDAVWVLPRSSAPEIYNPWAILWRCLRDPAFRCFSRTLQTCDRQTDRQTNRQTDTRRQLIPALW